MSTSDLQKQDVPGKLIWQSCRWGIIAILTLTLVSSVSLWLLGIAPSSKRTWSVTIGLAVLVSVLTEGFKDTSVNTKQKRAVRARSIDKPPQVQIPQPFTTTSKEIALEVIAAFAYAGLILSPIVALYGLFANYFIAILALIVFVISRLTLTVVKPNNKRRMRNHYR